VYSLNGSGSNEISARPIAERLAKRRAWREESFMIRLCNWLKGGCGLRGLKLACTVDWKCFGLVEQNLSIGSYKHFPLFCCL
jgi:hypothetical protein